MSNAWFRMYAEVLNDPKVQALPDDLFKAWVNILCLACHNKGTLPEAINETAFALRMSIIDAESVLDRLNIAGLIDKVKGGGIGYRIAPHGWEKRQYKSDGSTERVKRFRKRNETLHETGPDTDTDTEQKVSEAKASSPPVSPKVFKMPFEQIPPDWKVWALEEKGWSEEVLADVWDLFREYWQDGKGKNTKRSNWSATFRTWCRKENSFNHQQGNHHANTGKNNAISAKPTWKSEGQRLSAKYAEQAEREEAAAALGVAQPDLLIAETVRKNSG